MPSEKSQQFLDRAERARAARAELHEGLIAERKAQEDYSRSPRQIVDRTALGAIGGGLVGGAVGAFGGGIPGALAGAAKGAAYGAGAGAAGGVAEYGSGDPVVGHVVEGITDPLLSSGRAAREAVRHAPGATYPEARKLIGELDLTEGAVRGEIGHSQVVESATAGYAAARARTNALYDEWRTLSSGGTVAPEEVERALTRNWKGATSGVGEIPPRIGGLLEREEPWDAAALDELRRHVLSVRGKASLSGDDQLAKRAGDLLTEFDYLEDLISRRSPGGEAALKALKKARGARKSQGYLEQGTKGQDKLLEKNIFGRRTQSTPPDDPYTAVRNILTSKRPVEAVRQLRTAARAAERAGDPVALQTLNEGLKGTYLDMVFSRNLMAPGGAGRKAPALHNQLIRTKEAGKAILGESGYKRLEALVAAVSRDEGGKSVRVSLPFARDLMSWTSQGGATGAVVGGIAGSQFGGSGATAGMLAGGLAGTVFSGVVEILGPKAARRVALEAMQDPDLMRKIGRKAGSQEALALGNRLLESLIRRGVIGLEHMAGAGTRPEDQSPTFSAELERLGSPQITE